VCRPWREYAPGDTVREGLEKEVRKAKKGLWADCYKISRRTGHVFRLSRCPCLAQPQTSMIAPADF